MFKLVSEWDLSYQGLMAKISAVLRWLKHRPQWLISLTPKKCANIHSTFPFGVSMDTRGLKTDIVSHYPAVITKINSLCSIKLVSVLLTMHGRAIIRACLLTVRLAPARATLPSVVARIKESFHLLVRRFLIELKKTQIQMSRFRLFAQWVKSTMKRSKIWQLMLGIDLQGV